MDYEYRLAITDRITGEVNRTRPQEHEPRATFTRLADDATVACVAIERREIGRWFTTDYVNRGRS